MPDALSREGKHAVRVHGAQLLDWSPLLLARMLIFGVVCDDEPVPRRLVRQTVRRVVRAWWAWTMAGPGELFWDVQRDLIIRVEHGTPKRRTVKIVSHQAVKYPIVQRMGLDSVFVHIAPEPSPYGWQHLMAYGWA